MRPRTKPFPHQAKATARAVKQGSHAFFFEPRCGKSKAALDAAATMFEQGRIKRVAIIAPLTVLSTWEDQIMEHLSVPATVMTTGGETWSWTPRRVINAERRRSKAGKKPLRAPRLAIYLVNYDKFSRRGDDEAYRNDSLNALESWGPDLLVLDESHRVKAPGAVRSQALWRSVRRLRKAGGGDTPYVFLLTGTPNPKGYVDLFSQFRILDESIFGTNKLDFDERYCVYGQGRRKYTVVRYRRKEEILKKVKAVSSIVTADEAGLAGQEFFNPIRVTLPPQARRVYDELRNDFLAEIEGDIVEATNAGVRRLRLLQVTGGFTTDGLQIHDAKVVALRDYLTDLRELDQNVVLYARFLPEVRACTTVCEKLGYRTATITGATKRTDRADYIRRFQKSPGGSAIVFQPQAGSLGIELTAAAETVFYSLPDGWETFFQCLNRVKGPNQPRPVRHSYILCKGTLDLAVVEALRNKRDVHRELMRNPRDFLEGL